MYVHDDAKDLLFNDSGHGRRNPDPSGCRWTKVTNVSRGRVFKTAGTGGSWTGASMSKIGNESIDQ